MPAGKQAGMVCLNHWIPACAGMTEWLRGNDETGKKVEIKITGLLKSQFRSRRHSSESWNPVV